ncbi:MAG: stage V sporulation protein AB [Lachnospiraceae bacterium]
MEIFQNVILAVIGFSGGISVAAGTFALITILGIVPRLTGALKIGCDIYKMETVVALGGTVGSLITIYKFHVYIGVPGMVIAGIFAGIFVGSLAMSLAESLKVLPILFRRLDLKTGIPIIVVMIAFGKGLGTLYQLFFCGGI